MAQSSLCPSSVPLARVQTDNMGELALEHRGTWKGTIPLCTKKKKGRALRKCLQYGLEGAEYISNHKKPFWPPLQFFCFRPRSPPAIFWFCNLSHHARQKEHKQPYSKINTAILCVFTFHSAASICDSVPPNCSVPFHAERKTLFLGPLYRWTGSIASAIMLHNHFYLVPSCFLLFFYSGLLTCLNAKRWGFIAAGAGTCLWKHFILWLWRKWHVYVPARKQHKHGYRALQPRY